MGTTLKRSFDRVRKTAANTFETFRVVAKKSKTFFRVEPHRLAAGNSVLQLSKTPVYALERFLQTVQGEASEVAPSK